MPTRPIIENSKKIAKKFKKLENTIIVSFKAKIAQKRLRKNGKKKKKILFLCIPTQLVIENSKKIAKKFKKSENTIIASFRTKLGWEKLRKRENKKKSFPCVSTQPVIENSKIIVKEFKKLQNSIIASFQDKIGWERP